MFKDEKLTQVLDTLHKLTSGVFSDAIQRKLILDNLSEGVITVDSDLKIATFNKAAEKITGLAEKDAVGQACPSLFAADGGDNFCLLGQVIEQQAPVRQVTRQLSVRGNLIPVLVSASPLVDSGGRPIGGIQSFLEITEIFHRQLVLDSIFDGVFTVDLEQRITFFNQAAVELTGYSQEEVLGRHFVDVLKVVGSGSPDETALVRAMHNGRPVSRERIYLEVKEGRILPVSVSAAPLIDGRGQFFGGVEIFRDITNQIEQKYILDSVADGVFTVDKNFVITSFNRSAEQITGYASRSVLGRTCREIFDTDLCASGCPLARAIKTRSRVTVGEQKLRGKGGREIPVSVSSTALVDDVGNIIGGVGTFKDLTEVTRLRRRLSEESKKTGIISRSPRMQKILSVLPEFARSESTILILGESGTGKELIAQVIHRLSPRKDKPFVAVNSGALPDTLLESELFGYKAGAFTDARKDRKGRFAAAQGGSLFLDEIGDISQAMQVKLLRVIQTRMYEPLGSNTPVRTDVRIITATNRKLDEMVKSKEFREDLYYRLNVVKIELPPLRERMEDLPILIDHFIQCFNRQRNKKIRSISDEALAILKRYGFPGNIRELENVIEYAFIMCHDNTILPAHLPEDFLQQGKAVTAAPPQPVTLAEVEKLTILEALERNDFKKMKTCRELGISKDTLRRKLKAYGVVGRRKSR